MVDRCFVGIDHEHLRRFAESAQPEAYSLASMLIEHAYELAHTATTTEE
jgi:hypothetical protein